MAAAIGMAAVAVIAVQAPWLSGPRLMHGESSMQQVGERVLNALHAEDRQDLQRIFLSKEEFAAHVWPELPVSNPKTNVPLDFVWNDLLVRSNLRLEALVRQHQGRHYELVGVVRRGQVVEYRTHRAYPDMEVRVRDEGGREFELPLFGTLIEMDGVFKVYSFAPYD